jgi:hypothetical protein
MFSSLLRTEGFSCSLGILYRGLRISKLQFLIKKFIFSSKIQFLDPDPQLEKMLDPDPHYQCGSETLVNLIPYLHILLNRLEECYPALVEASKLFTSFGMSFFKN